MRNVSPLSRPKMFKPTMFTPTIPMMIAAGLALAVGGCGSTDTTRAASGGAGGAVAGAVVGGPVGAVVGGVGGAAAGASMEEGLGDKVQDWTSGGGSTSSANALPNRSSGQTAPAVPALSQQRVRAVQQALNDRNDGRDIAVDGLWGPNTRQALRRFQRSNGLDATGQLDGRTVAALNLTSQPGNGGQASNTQAGSSGPNGNGQGGDQGGNGGPTGKGGQPTGNPSGNNGDSGSRRP